VAALFAQTLAVLPLFKAIPSFAAMLTLAFSGMVLYWVL